VVPGITSKDRRPVRHFLSKKRVKDKGNRTEQFGGYRVPPPGLPRSRPERQEAGTHSTKSQSGIENNRHWQRRNDLGSCTIRGSTLRYVAVVADTVDENVEQNKGPKGGGECAWNYDQHMP